MAAQKTRHVHREHENYERRKGVGGVGQVQVSEILVSIDFTRNTSGQNHFLSG